LESGIPNTINCFYKSYVEADLASLHYFTFIEPLVVLPMKPLSFRSEQFINSSINKLIEAKINIALPSLWCTKNLMKFNSTTSKFLSSFQRSEC
jgi:hypothetical protein